MNRDREADPAAEWAAVLAKLDGVLPTYVTVEEAEAENLPGASAPQQGPDPVGRWTVKPVRGGVPDAPVARCTAFPPCPKGQRCYCPPVDVAAFQAKTEGTKSRGTPQVTPTMPRGPLRSTLGSDPDFASKVPMPPFEERDPALVLEPLPEFEVLPPLATTYTGHTTSEKPTEDTNPHLVCKREQAKLHTRTVRAEHKLVKALAEIERLKAEIARLKAPTAPKRPRKGK